VLRHKATGKTQVAFVAPTEQTRTKININLLPPFSDTNTEQKRPAIRGDEFPEYHRTTI
jgi:hypothetical protein